MNRRPKKEDESPIDALLNHLLQNNEDYKPYHCEIHGKLHILASSEKVCPTCGNRLRMYSENPDEEGDEVWQRRRARIRKLQLARCHLE